MPQLGLIALVLRDLDEGWFGIGYGKTRGLGTVTVEFNSAVVQYPGCILGQDGNIYPFGSKTPWDKIYLAGAGHFVRDEPQDNKKCYGFPADDIYEIQEHELTFVDLKSMQYRFGIQMEWQGHDVPNLFTKVVEKWSNFLKAGGAVCAS